MFDTKFDTKTETPQQFYIYLTEKRPRRPIRHPYFTEAIESEEKGDEESETKQMNPKTLLWLRRKAMREIDEKIYTEGNRRIEAITRAEAGVSTELAQVPHIDNEIKNVLGGFTPDHGHPLPADLKWDDTRQIFVDLQKRHLAQAQSEEMKKLMGHDGVFDNALKEFEQILSKRQRNPDGSPGADNSLNAANIKVFSKIFDLAVAEEAKPAPQRTPVGGILTPEKMKELQDELTSARDQAITKIMQVDISGNHLVLAPLRDHAIDQVYKIYQDAQRVIFEMQKPENFSPTAPINVQTAFLGIINGEYAAVTRRTTIVLHNDIVPTIYADKAREIEKAHQDKVMQAFSDELTILHNTQLRPLVEDPSLRGPDGAEKDAAQHKALTQAKLNEQEALHRAHNRIRKEERDAWDSVMKQSTADAKNQYDMLASRLRDQTLLEHKITPKRTQISSVPLQAQASSEHDYGDGIRYVKSADGADVLSINFSYFQAPPSINAGSGKPLGKETLTESFPYYIGRIGRTDPISKMLKALEIFVHELGHTEFIVTYNARGGPANIQALAQFWAICEALGLLDNGTVKIHGYSPFKSTEHYEVYLRARSDFEEYLRKGAKEDLEMVRALKEGRHPATGPGALPAGADDTERSPVEEDLTISRIHPTTGPSSS